MILFRKDDYVRHITQSDWGVGKVVEDDDSHISVCFENAGFKKFGLDSVKVFLKRVTKVSKDSEGKILDRLLGK